MKIKNYYINNIKLDIVREYKYLGIVCSINGRFTAAISDLMKRHQKACFKFCSLFNQRTIGPENAHLKPDLGVLSHHEMTLTLNMHTPLLTS